VLGTLGPGSRPASEPEVFDFEFLQLVSQLCHSLRWRTSQPDRDAHATEAIEASDPGTHGLSAPVIVRLLPDIKHNRAARRHVPQHRRCRLLEHPPIVLGKRPGMLVQRPDPLHAIDHLVAKPLPQSREMGGLLRATDQVEEASVGRRLRTGAVTMTWLIRRHGVIHMGIV
jgi:hypothetical protein